VLIERWRHEYNTFRPHSSLGDMPPSAFAAQIQGVALVLYSQDELQRDIRSTWSVSFSAN
jgi:hypothetical protein